MIEERLKDFLEHPSVPRETKRLRKDRVVKKIAGMAHSMSGQRVFEKVNAKRRALIEKMKKE